jgi:hypothetical protein
MEIQRVNFPPIIADNEETYLTYMTGLIESVDQQASMMITRRTGGIIARISPSEFKLFSVILDVVKKFHTMLGIEVEFSKSMKAGNNITFNINFEN